MTDAVIPAVLLGVNHTAETNCAAAVKTGPYSDEFFVMATRLWAAIDIPDATLCLKVTAAANHNKTCMSVISTAFRPLPDVARHVVAAIGTPAGRAGTYRQSMSTRVL